MIWTASRSPSARSVFPSSGCGDRQPRDQAGETAGDVAERARGRARRPARAARTAAGSWSAGAWPRPRTARGARGRCRRGCARTGRARSPLSAAACQASRRSIERLIGARRRRRQIRERQPEERRQPGAQPLGGIARIGDRAQQVARPGAPRRSRRDPPARPAPRGSPRAASASATRLRLLARAGQDEDLARVGARRRSGEQRRDLVGDRRGQPRAHHAHRQLLLVVGLRRVSSVSGRIRSTGSLSLPP